MILPALAATGLLDAMDTVFKPVKAAFYGMRSLVLTLVFASLVGEPRAEGLTRLNPVDLGRLLGLDRAPEVRRVRQRMAALGEQNRGDELFKALADRMSTTTLMRVGCSMSTGTSAPTTASRKSRKPMLHGSGCRCPPSWTHGSQMAVGTGSWSGRPNPARRWSAS